MILDKADLDDYLSLQHIHQYEVEAIDFDNRRLIVRVPQGAQRYKRYEVIVGTVTSNRPYLALIQHR